MPACKCFMALGRCPAEEGMACTASLAARTVTIAEHLEAMEARVAALEALRDKLLALDALWEAGGPEQQPRCGLCDYHPCGFPLLECPGFRPKQQGDPESEEYINNLMMRLKREPSQQPRCICGHPREWHLKDGQLDVCFTEGCKCIRWQPREGVR